VGGRRGGGWAARRRAARRRAGGEKADEEEDVVASDADVEARAGARSADFLPVLRADCLLEHE
jgi:hypothetical protein